jgi:hypothetical protein
VATGDGGWREAEVEVPADGGEVSAASAHGDEVDVRFLRRL